MRTIKFRKRMAGQLSDVAGKFIPKASSSESGWPDSLATEIQKAVQLTSGPGCLE